MSSKPNGPNAVMRGTPVETPSSVSFVWWATKRLLRTPPTAEWGGHSRAVDRLGHSGGTFETLDGL